MPVLASDFALWRELLLDSGAGRVADPMNPADIARVIGQLLADPRAAVEMGRRGREAVMTRYQWAFEEQRLLSLYEQLLGNR